MVQLCAYIEDCCAAEQLGMVVVCYILRLCIIICHFTTVQHLDFAIAIAVIG